MKIRGGFVSNSSSSSFCCIGIESPSDSDKTSIKREVFDTLAKRLGWYDRLDKYDAGYGIWKIENSPLVGYAISYVDLVYIGLPIEFFSEDLSIKAMRTYTTDLISKLLGRTVDPNFINLLYGEVSSE